jgi:hypothetical protein
MIRTAFNRQREALLDTQIAEAKVRSRQGHPQEGRKSSSWPGRRPGNYLAKLLLTSTGPSFRT